MTNKQRREIIENAKASGYDGSYVDLFRNSAAPLKLAVTEEERMKGLKPYNEPGGQAMALPNNPPNNPVNTIGTRPPIKTKSVGSKVGSAPVAPGISSFKGVVTAGDLRARGKYGRRRAQYGEPTSTPETAARPNLAPTEGIDGSWSSVPVEGTPVKDFLDRAQISLGALSLGAAATGVGEVVSVPADLVNAAISAGRAGYYAFKGDAGNAALYTGLAGLNAAAAIPVVGNVSGVAAIAKTAQALGKTKAVSQAAHGMHHGGEAVITAAKTADYIDLGDKTAEVIKTASDSLPASTFRGPKFQTGGYTNKFGRVRRLTGGPEDEVPQPVGGPETPFETSRRFQPVDAEGNVAEGLTNKWDVQALGETWDEQVDRFYKTHGRGTNSILDKKRKDRLNAAKDILREDKLDFQVSNYMSNMWDFENNKPRREDDPQAAMYINKMFSEVGLPDADSVNTPWSAATVTHLAKAIHPDFKGSPLHADYINRGFNKEGTHETRKIKWNDEFQVGDILFQGREDTAGWDYKDFKNASKKGQRYSSHTDIIVGKGVDEDGKVYYEVMGGNTGGEKDSDGNPVDGTQVTKYKKMYPNNIKGNYKGALVTGKEKEKEERKVAKKVVAGASSIARGEERQAKKEAKAAAKEAKETKTPFVVPKRKVNTFLDKEEGLDLNIQDFDLEQEEEFLQPSDPGYKAVTKRKVRSKLGRRLKDRRRSARKSK